MDDLDRLLQSLPPADLPGGLAGRVRANFRRRRQRQQRLHVAASLTLLVLGLWLGGPSLLALSAQIQSGAVNLGSLNVLYASLFDAGAALAAYTHGSNSFQAALNSSLGLTAWVGILALAAGALLGISGMVSRSLR